MEEELQVTVTVRNRSERTTVETVQLYVQDMVESVARPVKELKAFRKVELASDEEKEVAFRLTREDLKFYTKEMLFAAESGKFIVFVGPNVTEVQEERFTLR